MQATRKTICFDTIIKLNKCPTNIYWFKVDNSSPLTLNIFYTFYSVSIVDFEQENVSWVCLLNKVKILSVCT